MPRKNGPTIKDVAALCGLSSATVSRILNNTGSFTEDAYRKVMDAASQLNYSSKPVPPQDLKKKLVGIILNDPQNEWFARLLYRIQVDLYAQGYNVLIGYSHYSIQKEHSICTEFIRAGVSGLIAITCKNLDIITLTASSNIPLVMVDYPGDLPKNEIGKKVFCVGSNHYMGAYMATELLIKRGCKRILFLGRYKNAPVNSPRMDGYIDALTQYEISISDDLIVTLNEDDSNDCIPTKDLVYYLVKSGLQFDGVFAANDLRAYGALIALQSAGIRVPNDVRIIGFDDMPIAKFCSPSISTVGQNAQLIADNAIEILTRAIKTNTLPKPENLILPVSLIERDSTKQINNL